MSESSYTASSQHGRRPREQTGPQRVLAVVERYKRSDITKAGAILRIQEALFEGEVVVTTEDLVQALPIYISMLDEIDDSRRADRSGTGNFGRPPSLTPSEADDAGPSGSGRPIKSGESARGSLRRRASLSIDEAEEAPAKRGRFTSTVNEDLSLEDNCLSSPVSARTRPPVHASPARGLC